MADTLQHLVDGLSAEWMAALLLFALPFIREDAAIMLGGLMVVEHGLPLGITVPSLYAGIVASDVLLFGLGRVARRSSRLRRFLLRPRVERVTGWLMGHVGLAMVIARIVPGVIFPVYVGYGLLGVRLRVFAPITMLTAALYLSVLLWLVIRFGESVLSGAGYWAWILALVAVLLATSRLAQDPPWGLVLRAGRSGLSGLFRPVRSGVGSLRRSHAGMPSLRGLAARIGFAERIPTLLFYAPMAAQWLFLALRFRSLSLPALVNPRIEVGGLWGESKRACLDMVSGASRDWLAPYVALTRSADAAADGRRAIALAREAGLTFPLVAKPDIGWQGYGVRPIGSESALIDYVARFPADGTLILQQMIDWDGEAGVFYVRRPDEDQGHVVGLTLRYFPHVVGDGQRKVRDLILADDRAAWKAGQHLGLAGAHAGLSPEMLDRVPEAGEVVRLAFIGSIRVGGLYRNADDQITPALEARFDAISRSMPDFHYGRYDVRFSSMEALRAGEGFRIIEINGAGAEAISAWEPGTPLGQVYGRLLRHQRMLFEIGALNRARGFRPPGPIAILRAARQQNRLVERYPPSL